VDEGSFQPSETMLRLYPEAGAGGYTRHDGFVEFYTRVNALLGPRSRILDLGAGRGQWADDGSLPSIAHMLRSFHERVESVVGVDVDPVVLNNPTLADAQVIKPGETLSFPDGSFDVVLADHVLEHIDKPDAASLAADISRILRPGGWFVARTPNKWGMIGIGARVVPNRLHTRDAVAT
jgi:SAM-dependent methyltransferase